MNKETWFLFSSATDAPVHDLNLFQQLYAHQEINSRFAEAVSKTFNRHLWYLSQEFVSASLFSNKVSDMEKTDMVNNLKICESYLSTFPVKRHGSEFGNGKPVFPELTSQTI